MKKVIEKLRYFYYKYIKIPLAYRETKHLKIANTIDSINYIIEHRCSVSRYGDGEFDVMRGGARGFQKYDKELSKKLEEVLHSDLHNHIICLSYFIKDRRNLIPFVKDFWGFYVAMNKKSLLNILSFDKQYYDTQISRFYHAYKDKSNCKTTVRLLKKIWEGRDVLLVEGELTRSGVGNDLYSGAKSLKRILCPSENAFSKYNEIFETIKDNANKDTLILIALGMTATVLAYDLAKEGLQAIDIGHLDIEYEWMKQGVDVRVPVKGKYVNEAKEKVIEDCKDTQYLNSIIKKVL